MAGNHLTKYLVASHRSIRLLGGTLSQRLDLNALFIFQGYCLTESSTKFVSLSV